jgi:hypothetical protein
MLKLWMMLTCILFLGSMGTSQAAPLDSSDIVYIDGLPCNRACQSYMAWYRQATTPRQTAPVSQQLNPSELAEQLPKAEAQRTTKTRGNRPRTAPPVRAAKKAAPKPIEAPPAKTADLQPADRGEAKPATPEKIVDSPPSPTSNPTSGSDAGTTPQQVATAPAVQDLATATATPASEQKADSNTKPANPAAVQDLATATATPALEQKADSNTKPAGPTEAISPAEATPPADAATTALASPTTDDRLVAILLVRPEIKSVSDLAKKIVAIDAKRSESVASVRTAIVAAGAAEVQMSEGETLALTRVMDGEVPAAVVTLTSPDEAEMWSAGMPGLRVLRIPLSPPSEKARRG